jgi:hypothetical protein
MCHPELSERIEVDEVSVPHYQASGWQRADEAKSTTQAAARRRRPTKSGDEN